MSTMFKSTVLRHGCFIFTAALTFGPAAVSQAAFDAPAARIPAADKTNSRERMTNADFPTHLRPEPDSLKTTGKLEPSTRVTVHDMRVVQTGSYKENWYLVESEGRSGWVRGDELDGEKAEKNFSATYQAPDMPGVSGPGGVSF